MLEQYDRADAGEQSADREYKHFEPVYPDARQVSALLIGADGVEVRPQHGPLHQEMATASIGMSEQRGGYYGHQFGSQEFVLLQTANILLDNSAVTPQQVIITLNGMNEGCGLSLYHADQQPSEQTQQGNTRRRQADDRSAAKERPASIYPQTRSRSRYHDGRPYRKKHQSDELLEHGSMFRLVRNLSEYSAEKPMNSMMKISSTENNDLNRAEIHSGNIVFHIDITSLNSPC